MYELMHISTSFSLSVLSVVLILNPVTITVCLPHQTVGSKLNKDLMCNTIMCSDIWVKVIPLCTKTNCGDFVLFLIKLYGSDLYNIE